MNWKEKKLSFLKRSKTILIKIGSAVLTTEKGDINKEIIFNLVEDISFLKKELNKNIILVSSGAVASGWKFLKKEKSLLSLTEKQAAAAVGQIRLMHIYEEAFLNHGIVIAQILLTKDDLRNRNRFLNAKNTFMVLLKNKVIPIVNENDSVAIDELKFGDNDFLASLLLNLIQADLFINLTTAKGVFDKNPIRDKHAKKFDYIEDIDGLDLLSICDGKTDVGTGGMYSKLLAAKRAAQLGVPTFILPGKEKSVLKKAFSGEDIGTWIAPNKRPISQKKFWLAYNLTPCGEVIIDQGAKDALVIKNKSLLPAGVLDVKGNFESGSLIKIIDEKSNQIGVGITNFSSEEIKKIKGLKTCEIEKQLKRKIKNPEIIHIDNLIIGEF